MRESAMGQDTCQAPTKSYKECFKLAQANQMGLNESFDSFRSK